MVYIPKTGVGHVPSYQISGIPYATASFTVPASGGATLPTAINFPNVTKFVTVVNTHSGTNVPLRVGFSANGVNGAGVPEGSNNYFVLDNGDSYTGEWRVESVYLLSDNEPDGAQGLTGEASASVIAGLTGIMTGSVLGRVLGTLNWSGSIGVG